MVSTCVEIRQANGGLAMEFYQNDLQVFDFLETLAYRYRMFRLLRNSKLNVEMCALYVVRNGSLPPEFSVH